MVLRIICRPYRAWCLDDIATQGLSCALHPGLMSGALTGLNAKSVITTDRLFLALGVLRLLASAHGGRVGQK